MTPQEATDKLFIAAKSGDIAAAQAAIDAGANLLAMNRAGDTPKACAHDNGHADMVELLNSAWYRHSDRMTKENNVASNAGMLAVTILGMALLGHLANSSRQSPVPDNRPSPKNSAPVPKDVEEAQKQLRSVLKDPAMTDRLIEQIKESSVIEEFMADPEIVQNLQKVSHAIEENAKDSPGRTTEQISGIEDSKNRNESRNWSHKAIQEKGAKSLEKS